MSCYGKNWKIDGLIAGGIWRDTGMTGRYSVLFERAFAALEQIEKINWAKPTVQYIGPHKNEKGLPEGYGFEVEKITYDSGCKTYRVHLKTASQYLGDVTGYQAEISDLNEQVRTLTGQLAEADELAIALYEAQESEVRA